MTWTERLGITKYIDLKSLIFGSAIATSLVILGLRGGPYEYAFPFASIGFLYVGYKAINWKMAAVLGAISAIPITLLIYYGGFGTVKNMQTFIIMVAVVLLVGLFVSLVGFRVKRDREKAKVEYDKQKGKNKNKKKNKKEK